MKADSRHRRKKKYSGRTGRARRKRELYMRLGLVLLLLLTVAGASYSWVQKNRWSGQSVDTDASEPEIDVQLLDINPYSRPGTAVEKINGIVIHYTANPGTSAQANRDYFNGLKDSHETEASSNFVIGIQGEIIQCVPTWEIAYASNERNADTVSIECCHPDESGKFTDQTYESLVQLSAWLCVKFGLTEDDIIRHYDVTGKICPKFFVENEDAWDAFKKNVGEAIEKTKDS